MAKFGIGQSARRLEDPRLLTGGGRYTDDTRLSAPAARAYVLRSPHAHADIRSIDTAAARKAPGVLLVLTHENMPAQGASDTPVPQQEDASPQLAGPEVRHYHQAVAFVVAETFEQARAAASQIAALPRPVRAAASIKSV